MSSTSVTAGPGLMTLPIQRSLSFSSPISITRRNSSELPSKYFLSPGLESARPSRNLLSIFVAKNSAQLLSSFMVTFVRGLGFEPRYAAPKTAVLPLDDPRAGQNLAGNSEGGYPSAGIHWELDSLASTH